MPQQSWYNTAMKFKIIKKDKTSRARAGEIKTLHGVIKTPCFVPDATYGAVKHATTCELENLGLQMVLGNIYHLWIRPGIPMIKKLGGLHKFMNWNRPVITDSGGFQVFSLVYRNKMGKVLENGIKFKDHLTGSNHYLTPAKSISAQLSVGSDILMVLDYPVSPAAKKKDNELSVALTSKWAKMSKNYFQKQKESRGRVLMAIIQGANEKNMRRRSYEELSKIDFDGYGFGGPPLDYDILKYTASLIPDEKIRYVMGGGTPKDILESVRMGWDMFDCVIPTRNARHGLLYTFNGEIRMSRQEYTLDQKPIEKNCPCTACKNNYSRAYLRHLFKVKEPLAARLFTLHNLTFYTRLMEKIRENIEKENFEGFYKKYKKKL